MYVKDKIYRLSAPTDGKLPNGDIARFPVGLPVKFVEQKEDRFIVVEPYGRFVEFPLCPVWRMGQQVDIFKHEPVNTDSTLEEYADEKEATAEWERCAHPEKHRWYVDDVREKLGKKIYVDWECGITSEAVSQIMNAAKHLFLSENGTMEHSQEMINAICDLSLLIYEDDSPGWCKDIGEDIARESAYVVVQAVEQMLTVHYFVKSGKTWNLKKQELEEAEE